jgi:hypothetical protein
MFEGSRAHVLLRERDQQELLEVGPRNMVPPEKLGRFLDRGDEGQQRELSNRSCD